MKIFFVNRNKKKPIELDEVLLGPAITEDSKIEDSFDNRKIRTVEKIFFAAMAILVLQSAFLQIIKGGYYTDISQKNYTKTISVRSPRGIVYDKDHKQIIFNVPVFDLVVMPLDFLSEKEKVGDSIEKLSKISGVDGDELKNRIEKNKNIYQSVLILGNIKKEEALVLEEKTKDIAGVKLEKNATRDYIDGYYFSHIIGYIGKISEKELNQNPKYLPSDIIGKDGLELFYEKQLRGVYGERKIEVDSLGNEIKTINNKNPVSGNNLVLNIDSDLQKKSYEELEKFIKKAGVNAGAIVAINPKNGAILSLISYPSYDNNLFAKGITNDEYNKLKGDKALPFINRAISGEYPPGSTLKLLIGSAALQEKIISPTKTIEDRGVIYVGSRPYLGWTALGAVDLIRAISMSSNIYFYTVGGGYGDIKGLGIERIKKYASLFGLGSTVGIDLPGEKSGLAPDEQWKISVKNEKWYIGDTYNVSIGQGDVLATPLQIASYVSVIANGGKLFQPQVVDKIIDSDGNVIEDISPKIIRENFIDGENLKWIQKGMRENVASGSGIALKDLPFEVAGKTGTAQYYGNKKTHAWYVAYAPYKDPEIVLAVLVEGGGEGHTTAVPIVKEILKWYFEKLNDENVKVEQ